MIAQDVRNYLCTVSGLVSLFSPVATISGIFVIQAPTGALMPYMVVENSEGPREIIAANTTEETANLRITVDVGPTQMFKGSNLAEAALRALENYRGNMGNAKDIWCSCSSIRGWAGSGGATRYQFNAKVEHIMPVNKPAGSL
jgi:hypothetical protein